MLNDYFCNAILILCGAVVCLFVCFRRNDIGYYLSWILIDPHPQLLGSFSMGSCNFVLFFNKINYCLHYWQSSYAQNNTCTTQNKKTLRESIGMVLAKVPLKVKLENFSQL